MLSGDFNNDITLGVTMTRRARALLFVGWWAVVLMLAYAIYRWSGLSYWWAVGIVCGALILNGIMAEVEDRLPGGFLNPKRSNGEHG